MAEAEESKTVRFVHYTTQEYFSRNPEHLLRNPHRVLADVCVSYLEIDDFMASGYKEDAYNRRLSSHIHRYPFLRYAAMHWEDHAMAALPFANNDEKSQTLALELQLLRNNELMESYLRARGEWKSEYYTVIEIHEFRFERRTGMQFAAAKGNDDQVLLLLEAGLDPNESRYGTTALIEAVRGHHESVVKLLIESKANVGFQSKASTHTALTIALGMEPRWINLSLSRRAQKDYHSSTKAHEPIVALLLEAGADPEHGTEYGENLTPLMHASKHGMEAIVARLCRAGADVNRQAGNDKCDNGGQTAIHVAAANGHERIVEQLMQYGCDPDTADNRGKSPVDCAAEGQYWKIVELLLGSKAVNLDRKTSSEDTLLELACQSDNLPDALTERLLMLTSPDRVNSSGRPLICAAGVKSEAVVKMLLEAGVDPRLTDKGGGTALHAVARLESSNRNRVSIAIARALLDVNLGVDTQDCDGVTALMLASRAGQNELLAFLLKRGANILLKDNKGRTALTFAAKRGHTSTIRILVSSGADVNAVSENGTTALISAAENGDFNAAAILIEADAQVNALLTDGTSALILSATGGYKDLTKLLLTSGADATLANHKGETALIGVTRAGIKHIKSGKLNEDTLDLLPILLEAGVDVNQLADNGDTALLLATDPKYPRPNDARLLLEAGADPSVPKRAKQDGLISWSRISKMDTQVLITILSVGTDPNEADDNGMTALMRVSWAGYHVDKLKVLLDHGANPEAVNDKGQTALTLAVHKSSGLSTQTVRALLKAGANPNHEDARGRTVLFHLVSRCWSNRRKWERVFKALVDAGGNIHAIHKDPETLLKRSSCRPGMTKFLLAAGANLQGSNIQDDRIGVMLAEIIATDEERQPMESFLNHGVDWKPVQKQRRKYTLSRYQIVSHPNESENIVRSETLR